MEAETTGKRQENAELQGITDKICKPQVNMEIK